MRTTLLLALMPLVAGAHELQENRATIVLRDQVHVSVTLYLNYCEALYQALAPQRPYAAFLVVYSGMKPDELQKELLKAQAKFQAGTRLHLSAGGDEAPLTGWVWPDLKQVQDLLRRELMQAMVDPASHTHEAPSEVRVEARAPRKVGSVFVRFPVEFRKVLVVSYRPNQTWAEPKGPGVEVKF